MNLLTLIGIGILGLLLHVLTKLYEDYKEMLSTPDDSDDKTFWQVWKKKNLVLSLISLALVAGYKVMFANSVRPESAPMREYAGAQSS